jgi:hypothetical protein
MATDKTFEDVACQRLGSNPDSKCPLYGWRAAYIREETFIQVRVRKDRVDTEEWAG